MSTLAAKEEIVSCATCAQTRANGYSQRRLAVDVRADDFSRDDQFPFFCCDANGQTNDKQGGKKEAKLKGKNRGKWPRKRNVMLFFCVWGAFERTCFVSTTQKEESSFSF